MTTHDFRPGDVVECREWDGDEWTPATVSSIGITGRVHMRTADGAAVSCSEHMAPTCIRYRECDVCAAKPGTPALCADCLERRARLCKPAITIQRPGEWSAGDAPTEHPSRSRAASSLRAASASLTTAIDHLTRAGEAETYPGQTVIRIRTASEETQACIQHATMALYWMLHERLGS